MQHQRAYTGQGSQDNELLMQSQRDWYISIPQGKRTARPAPNQQYSGSGIFPQISQDHSRELSSTSEDDTPPKRASRHRSASRASALPKSHSMPVRDEAGRFTGVRMKTADERNRREGGGVFKTAAIEVLRREMRLLSTGDITKIALAQGLLGATGKTPEATMASALYTDVKRKENQSSFIRPVEGMFGLREWAHLPYDSKYRIIQHAKGNEGTSPSFSAQQQGSARRTASYSTCQDVPARKPRVHRAAGPAHPYNAQRTAEPASLFTGLPQGPLAGPLPAPSVGAKRPLLGMPDQELPALPKFPALSEFAGSMPLLAPLFRDDLGGPWNPAKAFAQGALLEHRARPTSSGSLPQISDSNTERSWLPPKKRHRVMAYNPAQPQSHSAQDVQITRQASVHTGFQGGPAHSGSALQDPRGLSRGPSGTLSGGSLFASLAALEKGHAGASRLGRGPMPGPTGSLRGTFGVTEPASSMARGQSVSIVSQASKEGSFMLLLDAIDELQRSEDEGSDPPVPGNQGRIRYEEVSSPAPKKLAAMQTHAGENKKVALPTSDDSVSTVGLFSRVPAVAGLSQRFLMRAQRAQLVGTPVTPSTAMPTLPRNVLGENSSQ